MKIGIVIGLAALCAVLGFALGTTFFAAPASSESSDEDAREIRDLKSARDDLRAKLAGNEEKSREGAARTRQAEDELASLRENAAEGPVETEPTPGPAPVDPKAADPKGPVFFADAYGGALRKVDWNVVGTNLSKMVVLIPRIATDLAKNQSPKPDDLGRVQQLNGPLVTAALKIRETLPGVGVNGKFSDPSFMINAMATTLSIAGQALSEAQSKSLETTAVNWMAKDRQRRDAYDDRTWVIQKLYEEGELKDGFFAEAFTHLTKEQVDTLSPAHVRGRVRLDLFSSSILFTALSRPDFFATREDLVESTLRGVSMNMRLSEEERDRARPVIAAWIESLPTELTEHPTDALDQHGLIHVSLVLKGARHQERLLKDLARTLELDEERLNGIKQYAVVHVPLPKYKAE